MKINTSNYMISEVNHNYSPKLYFKLLPHTQKNKNLKVDDLLVANTFASTYE